MNSTVSIQASVKDPDEVSCFEPLEAEQDRPEQQLPR